MRAYERTRERIEPAFPPVRPPAATGSAGRAVDVLLLGVDDTVETEWTAGMIALVHIGGDRKGVFVLSIPHTTVVPVPGSGERSVGAALSLGGVPLAVQTVEGLLQHRIDHVAVLPLTALAALTDAVGGVPVDNGRAFLSDGIEFPPGRQHLDGRAVVAFVRRTGSSAVDRIEAEHAYLRGLTHRLLGHGARLERGAVRAISATVIPRLATDAGLDAAAVVRLALPLRALAGEDLHVLRLPTEET